MTKFTKNFDKKGKSNKDQGFSKQTKNDFTWYQITPEIGASGASLPYNIFTGTHEAIFPETTNLAALGATATTTLLESVDPQCAPGVFTLRYWSTPGTGRSGASAVNTASKSVYSFVRHMNSGSKNYEAPDLMMYVLGMSQVYLGLGELKRAIRIAQTFSTTNRYVGDGLLHAQGLSTAAIADLRGNLANYRTQLNILIKKTNALFIPKAFKSFERQALLSSCVIADSTSPRSQFYMFISEGLMRMSFVASSGTSLHPEANAWSGDTGFKNQLDFVTSLLEHIWSDEDCNIMSGDIYKAYGEENCYSIPELGAEELQTISYDEDILNQIQNSICAPYIYGTEGDFTFSVVQNSGAITFAPSVTEFSMDEEADVYRDGQLAVCLSPRYFNSHKDKPSWEDNLEWSRLCMGTFKNADDGAVYVNASTELLVGYGVTYFEYSDEGHLKSISGMNFNNVLASEDTALKLLAIIGKFDWHPALYLFSRDGANRIKHLGVLFDLRMHTLIHPDTVNRLNDLATMGLFVTPAILRK